VAREVLVLVGLAGCAGEAPTTGHTGDSGVQDDGALRFGTWDLTVHTSDFDTCGITTEEEREDPCSRGCGTFELIDEGGGAITLSANWQDYVLTCALDDSGFLCTPLQNSVTVDGLDAVGTEWDAVIGTFEGSSQLYGAYTFERSCEGPDCSALEAEVEFDLDCVLMGRLEGSYAG